MLRNTLTRTSVLARRWYSNSVTSSKSYIHDESISVPLTEDHNATIAVINMCDNESRNSLSKSSVYTLLTILEKLQLEAEARRIRALVVRSQVKGVFCAGANLKERRSMTRSQVESWLKVQRRLMDNLSEFPYPTIAAVDGHALGGGLELALACDIRIVNEKVKVGLVETSWAIIPGAGGTQRLSRLIGVGRAKEHIFVAEPINGIEATRLGIANHLTSGEDSSFQKAIELARKICKRGPRALRLAKAAIDNGCQTSLDTGLDIEQAYYGQLLDSADRAEGMRAFSEKREPVYISDE